jgi:hypothetical protein
LSNTAAIEKARQGKRRAIEKLYGLITLHEPYVTSDPDLADRLRLPKQDVQNARQDLVTIEALTIRKMMKTPNTKHPGWATEWTLVTPVTVALARLEAKWRKDDEHTHELLRVKNPLKASSPRAKAARAAAAANGWTNGAAPAALEGATIDHPVLPDVLVASAGPEPSLKPLASLSGARMDEPRALIEAARQYHTTNSQLDQKIKELEAMGVTVDRVALGKAIKAPHDHQLLVVSKVLPYVDGLERQNERLTAQAADLRDKVANLPELNQRLSRLHSQNERLGAENTEMRKQLHERGVQAPRIAPKPEVAVTPGNAGSPDR